MCWNSEILRWIWRLKRTCVRLQNDYNRGQKVVETYICPLTPSPRQVVRGVILQLRLIKYTMRGIRRMGLIIRGIRQRLVHKEVIIVFVREGGSYRPKLNMIH